VNKDFQLLATLKRCSIIMLLALHKHALYAAPMLQQVCYWIRKKCPVYTTEICICAVYRMQAKKTESKSTEA